MSKKHKDNKREMALTMAIEAYGSGAATNRGSDWITKAAGEFHSFLTTKSNGGN